MSCAPWLLRTRRGGDSAAAAGVVARVRRGLGRRSTNNIADLLNGKEKEQEKEEQEKEKKQQYHRIGSLLPNGPDTTTATTTACSSARVVQQHQQQGVDELRQQKQGLDQRQNPSQEAVEDDSTAAVNRDCTLRAGGSPEAENKETRCNDGDCGDGDYLLFHSSSRQQLKEQQQRDSLRYGSHNNTNQCSNSSASRSSSSNDRRRSTSSSSSSNRQVGAAGGTTSRLQGRSSCAAIEVGGEQISSNNSSRRRRSLSSVEEGEGDEVAAALSAAARTTAAAAAANKLASHDAQAASTDTAAAATITEKRVSNAIHSSSSSRYQVGSGKKQSNSIFTSHESGVSKGAPEVYHVLPREERRSLDMAGCVSLSERDRSFPTAVSQHGHTHAAESLSSFEVSDASSEETAALPAMAERRQQQCSSSSSSRAAVVETRSTREAANNSITATTAARRTFGAVGGGNNNASPCSSGRGRGGAGAEEEEYEYGKESRIVSARGVSSHYSRHSELTGKRHTGVGGRVTERWSSLFLRSRGSTLADDKAPSVLPMSEIDWIIVDRLSRKTNSSNFATVLKAYLIIKTRVAAQRASKEYTQSQRKGQHAGAAFKNLLLRHRQNNRVALRVRPAATEASSSGTTAAVRGGHDAAAAAAVVADAVTTVEAVSRVEAAAANREREKRRRNRRRGSAFEKRTGGGSDSSPTRCHNNGSKEEIDEEHITADDGIEALSGEGGSIIGGGMISESCDISLSSASLTPAAVSTTMFPCGDITAAATGGRVVSTTAATATTKAAATKAEATTGGPSFSSSSSSSCARGYPRLKGVGDVGRMQAHQSLLEQRLAFLGLCSVHIKGDGNCLFRSCSYNLYGSEDYHCHVRMHATRHMRSSQYRKEYSVFFENDKEFEIYLKNMQRPGTWGDELCVRAIADAFVCTIHIITSTDSNWYLRYDSAQTIDSHRDNEYNDIEERNTRAAGQYTTVELPKDSFRDTKKHIFLTYISPIHYNAFTIAEADRSDISSN